MAQQQRPDNFDALGSIYDFLFAEAKKAPDKRRPIKIIPGTPNDTALTDAVLSALAVPGAFVNDTVLNSINQGLDLELGRVTYGENGVVKFSTTTLVDIIKDPEGAFKKAVDKEKAIRKRSSAMFLGESMTDLLHNAWAKKYTNIEVQRAIYGNTIAKEAEKHQISEALRQHIATRVGDPKSHLQQNPISGKTFVKDRNFLANRSTELISRKIFKPDVWNRMSDAEKAEFSDILGSNKTLDEIKGYIQSKYASQGARAVSEISDRFDRVMAPTGLQNQSKLDIFNPKVYRSLEEKNLTDRIAKMKDGEDKFIYEKTLHILRKDPVALRGEIKDLENLLKHATTPAEKKEYKEKLKITKEAYRVLGSSNLTGRIGQIEGYINSLNNVYGGVFGTNVVGSILNGDLYDARRNSLFNPVSEQMIGGTKIFIPKIYTDENGNVSSLLQHKLLSKYNESLTALNYLTPRSIIKNFGWNGEGFKYLQYKNLSSITKLQGFSSLNIDKDVFFELLSGEKSAQEAANILNNAKAVMTPENLQKLEKLLNNSEKLNGILKYASFGERVKQKFIDSVKKRFDERLVALRTKVVEAILKNPKVREAFAKVGADLLLKQWVAKGGLTVMVRAVITGIVATLGIVMTPIVSAIVGAITWIVSDLIMKAIGVLLNIAKYVIIFCFIVIFFVFYLGAASVAKFNQTAFVDRSEIPGSVVQCTMYEEVEIEEGEQPWGDTIIPPGNGGSCIFGGGSFSCSQGYKDVSGWSHQNIKDRMPVDLTNVNYLYTPAFCDTGDCRVTRIAKIDCSDGSNAGGIVEFTAKTSEGTTYQFKALHVKPGSEIAVGVKLSGNTGIAVVQTASEVEKGNCWTGKHLHLETRQNGSVVDPLKLLQSFNCSVPNESGCQDSK